MRSKKLNTEISSLRYLMFKIYTSDYHYHELRHDVKKIKHRVYNFTENSTRVIERRRFLYIKSFPHTSRLNYWSV